MNQQAHILVVDDEADIRVMISEYLGLRGYRVTTMESAVGVREAVAEEAIDLALLDIDMPGEDGLSLARALRETTKVGIVMLTAAGETIDRVVGLETGADDYVVKPVDLRELLARVKAVLRRPRAGQSGAGQAGETSGTATEALPQNEVAFGGFRLNLDTHVLLDEAGNNVPITGMEYDLLKAFADHPNRILSRERLLELAHGRGWEPFGRSIDVRIARLRRKIETNPKKPQIIKTVRCAGYIFSPTRKPFWQVWR